MTRIHRKTLAGALVAGGLAAGAFMASPAAAWDELPCGETEQTAHLCAPGEVARDGTIPNPKPPPDNRPSFPPPTTPPAPPEPLTCEVLHARYPDAGPNRVDSWEQLTGEDCSPEAPPPTPPPRREPVCAVVRFSDTFVPNHTLAFVLGGAPVYNARTTVTAVHGHVRGVLRAKFAEDYSYFLRPGQPRSVGMRLNLREGESRTIVLPFNHTARAFKEFFNLRFTARTNCATTSINKRRFEAKVRGLEDRA